jgi:hypothetical protein
LDDQREQSGIERAAALTGALGTFIVGLVMLLMCGCCLWSFLLS